MPDALDKLITIMFQAHPWHGVPPGDPAGVIEAYIEIVPTDTVKYELDKERAPPRRSAAALLQPAAHAVRLHPADLLRNAGGPALLGALRRARHQGRRGSDGRLHP